MLLRLLIVFYAAAAGCSAAAALSSTESEALLSMKSSLTDSSGSFSSWSPSAPYCSSWAHVTCSGAGQGPVVGLDLSSLNVSGAFPLSLSLLPSLRLLNLSNNLFSGDLPPPPFFSLFTDLRVLDLYNNNLTGPLPDDISTLRHLIHLDLGGNFFSGDIPNGYGGFVRVEYLALSGNSLTGKIPPSLGNLTTLRKLYLGYFNVFDGGIPLEIGQLMNLVRLDVASCGLSGFIPPELGNLSNLDTLFLQVNSLAGNIPAELGKLYSLKSMDISNNLLNGGIPATFSELKNLTLLNVFRNKLAGAIPEFIGELPALEVLQLWENNFTGLVPTKLGLNRRLKFLDVSSNKLTGLLPPDLCMGNQMQTLIVIGNSFFGPIPESLGECRSLKRIRMGENFFNGSIPAGILDLPLLTQLELQDNLLTGGFPDAFVSPSIGEIDLSNNELTGSLPESMGGFSGLQKLLLGQNMFSGRIPAAIGKLQQLSKLDFSGNLLSGPITPEINECKLLTYIDLSRNKLSENIPPEISNMRILNYLNLSRNDLQGIIPVSISAMQSLTAVDFSYNNLSGFLPTTGQFSFFNSSSFVGNPGLCGPNLGSCSSSTTASNGKHRVMSFKIVIIMGILVSSIVIATLGIIKARALKKANTARAWKLIAFQRLEFTSNDVLDCLREENIIGKGGAGIVFKGVMPNGERVAVKRLSVMSRGSLHDHGFSAEIQTLGRIRHRHIVKLLGYCSNKETNLLVYEYMPNGSLGEILHGKKGGHLHWDTRYKIAVEAAKGLCYLHHDCSPLIVHRDVKSNNILLDSDFETHVADFGLAKFLQGSGTSESMSAIAGSYGYIAPEYAYTLKVDEKSDVYSFGVVLLELITGRKPVGEFGDGVDIVQWVRMTTESNKQGVIKIIDPRLSSVPLNEVMHVFSVAMLCVAEKSAERPTMREVVQILTEFSKADCKSEDNSLDESSDPLSFLLEGSAKYP